MRGWPRFTLAHRDLRARSDEVIRCGHSGQGPGGEARFKSADSPDSEGHAEPSKFVVRYLAGVKAWRWVVLSIWALLFIIGGLFGKNLLKRVGPAR